MIRREVIALLGVAAAWPLAARGQQPAMPVIGYLHTASPGPFARFVTAFRQGLREPASSRGRTWLSNTAGPRAATTGCRRWLPSWRGGRYR